MDVFVFGSTLGFHIAQALLGLPILKRQALNGDPPASLPPVGLQMYHTMAWFAKLSESKSVYIIH